MSAATLAHLYADSIEAALGRSDGFRAVGEVVRKRVTHGQDRGRLFDAIDILIKAGRVESKLIDGVPSIGPKLQGGAR